MQYVIGLYTIQKATFEGCSSLTSVHIPSSLTSIGDEAFQMCTGLQKIYVPRDGMSISLGNDAFYSCNVLQDFSRDIEFTSIGDRCF
ncbi:MAG: leucine-rich repeat domain-containing protein [Mycoplasmoidaceae bacterium]|nr:leucine-rich repeat domain-containing protein [Mycoplasmoidaceae bacterium]